MGGIGKEPQTMDLNAGINLCKMGQRIRNRREELGLERLDVALAIGYSDESSLARIEYGARPCPLEKLGRISLMLKVSVDYLLWGDMLRGRYDRIMELVQGLDGDELDWCFCVLSVLLKHPAKGAIGG